MALIICAGCGRRRNATKVSRAVEQCFVCGAFASVMVRGAQMTTLLATTDGEGVDRRTARHQTYAGLRKYQEVKNFKPGFVAVKFKEIFGTWPNGEEGTPAEPMTHELSLWLRRGKSRYAAQRAKEKKSSMAASKARGGLGEIIKRQQEMMKRGPLSSS